MSSGSWAGTALALSQRRRAAALSLARVSAENIRFLFWAAALIFAHARGLNFFPLLRPGLPFKIALKCAFASAVIGMPLFHGVSPLWDSPILARPSALTFLPFLNVFPSLALLIFSRHLSLNFLPLCGPGFPFFAATILAMISGDTFLPLFGLGFPFLAVLILARDSGDILIPLSPPSVSLVSFAPIERKCLIQNRSASRQNSSGTSSKRKIIGFLPSERNSLIQFARWLRYYLQSSIWPFNRLSRFSIVLPIYLTDWFRGSSRA